MSSDVSQQTEAVLLHHLQAFGAGNVDEILADYTADSLVVTPDGEIRGMDGLRQLFTQFVTVILPPGCDFEILQQIVDGEHAYIFWKAESDNYDVPFATDTFVVRDEKIVFQSFAGQLIPKTE